MGYPGKVAKGWRRSTLKVPELRLLDILTVIAGCRARKALSLSVQDPSDARGVERLVWDTAVQVYQADLPGVLSDLLNGYTRVPGMDAVARLTPICISLQGYEALRVSLKAATRRNVRFFDHGWHLELRSRLSQYLCRGLQRQLVESGDASEVLVEDLVAHDLGV